MTDSRLQTIHAIIKQADLDAIALIPGANLHLMTGADFHLMERPLIAFFLPDRDPVAIVPALEQTRLAASGLPFVVFAWSDSEGYWGAFEAATSHLGLDGKRIGVEELRMRVLEAELIRRHIADVQLVLAGSALAALRLHKDAAAVESLRAAVAISEAALRATLAQVRPGMTERTIAGILAVEQLQRGGGRLPFDTIVLGGPNSALPHGEPGDRPIAAGEPLLFDFGTTVRGWASDITRTFAVGEPSPRLAEVYAVVQAANAAGRAACAPGVLAQEVDRITRRVIEEAGFGAYFTHRTGHGLGLETHEEPNIVEGNRRPLEPGNVFTIEPGIYIPGEVGVRIEDNMLITKNGAESLTTFPRDLTIIGQ